MTSAVIDSGGSGLEFDDNGVENQEENDPVSKYPAVIVEPVPSARLEQGYAAQVLVYDDETYLMQDVAEEQEIETETVETDDVSDYYYHCGNQFCTSSLLQFYFKSSLIVFTCLCF